MADPGLADAGPEFADFAGDARALLAAIASSSNDAIVGKDLTGTVRSWNEAAERLFGYSAAEMIGQSITRIIPTERLHEEETILERVGRGEILAHFETERRARDGHIIPISVTVSPIRDASGRVVGVSKIARDLTEAHRLNRELQRREALLQSILETVPDGLVVIDRHGAIQSFSPAAERMFGYTRDAVLGHNVSLLMPEADAGRHDAHMQRYLATGERRIIGIGRVVAGRRRDGSVFPMELQIGEVVLPGVQLFTGFGRDLTERQERERRLSELQAQLIHVSRLSELGQMVSALAHEVNQPLTAIALYIGGIRRLLTSASPPALHQAVERVAEQAGRASSIVQGLRSLVRKETRQMRTESIETMINETASLALIGGGRPTGLDLRIAPDATLALVDKVQIQQVLLNLMRNAVEAMADAPVRRLTITAARAGARIEIRVADTGPGLPDSMRSRLFHPFVTTKPDGLGIGLSICRSIVELHGGELTAASAPGGGTEFSFSVAAPEEAHRPPG